MTGDENLGIPELDDDEDLDAALAASDSLVAEELAQIVSSPADLCRRTEAEVAEELLSQSPTNTATAMLSVGWATARILFGGETSEEASDV